MIGVFVQVNEDSQRSRSEPVGYVIQESGCWEWVGGSNAKGYGHWAIKGKTAYAHRRMYERNIGPIPSGMTLDHLCRNKLCVNPTHLEVVTNRDNILRGNGPTAINARKTACKRGHPLVGDNVKVSPDGRRCAACVSSRNKRA